MGSSIVKKITYQIKNKETENKRWRWWAMYACKHLGTCTFYKTQENLLLFAFR